MSSADPQRVYLVGAGTIAQDHVQAALRLPVPARLAVCDTDPRRLTEFTADHPHVRAFDSLSAMLGEPPQDGDIVIVATPPDARSAIVGAALDSGRHVLCEKPLALTVAEARLLNERASLAGRELGSCSNRFLGTETIRRVKELQLRLGTPYHVTFRHREQQVGQAWWHDPRQHWRLSLARSGGGTLQDWGCYDLAVLLDVLSPVRVQVWHAWTHRQRTATAGPGLRREVEDQIGAAMTFTRADGGRTDISYERAAGTYGRSDSVAEMECPGGAVSWQWRDWDGPGLVTVTTERSGQLAEETMVAGWGEPAVVHDRPLHQFWAHLAGRPAAIATGAAAVFEFACVRAIYDAASTGQPQTVRVEDWSP